MISRSATLGTQKSHFCHREKMPVFSGQMLAAHLGRSRKPRGGRFLAFGTKPFDGSLSFPSGRRRPSPGGNDAHLGSSCPWATRTVSDYARCVRQTEKATSIRPASKPTMTVSAGGVLDSPPSCPSQAEQLPCSLLVCARHQMPQAVHCSPRELRIQCVERTLLRVAPQVVSSFS